MIGDVKYFQSSLFLPSTATSLTDIYYAVYFVAPTEYESDFQLFFVTFKNELLLLMALMVLAATVILFLIIWCIIVQFSKKITNPMVDLTNFTNKLKKTQSIEKK